MDNHKALPASAVTSEAVDYISTDSQQFAEFVENQHIQRKQHYEQWINDVVQQDLREKRKIAPGYLDSTNRILQPVKVETKSTPEPERATLNQVNEIDKMFGKVEISSGSTPQSPQ